MGSHPVILFKIMKIATTAVIASTLLQPALCSNLRRKDVDVSNKAFSSVEGTLLKTLRHPSISPLHSKLRDEPCTAEFLALFECEGVTEAGECLTEILTGVSFSGHVSSS